MTCDVNCDHLVKFLHCEVTLLLFEISIYFGGDTLQLYKYPVSQILPTSLASFDGSCHCVLMVIFYFPHSF